MIDGLKYLLIALAAYLLGSFSTGILVAKKAGHDIRSEGSKNTGASNALRILGVKGGALVFIGDFLKKTFGGIVEEVYVALKIRVRSLVLTEKRDHHIIGGLINKGKHNFLSVQPIRAVFVFLGGFFRNFPNEIPR